MRIGIDFDNTIACYDGVFHAAAVERGLIPAALAASIATDKTSVREQLRAQGRDPDFTELQGYVYGPGMKHVRPYPGLVDFLASAGRAGHQLYVVSHKTRTPFAGPAYDLHEAAREFLRLQKLVACEAGVLAPESIYFELTKEEKVARVASLGCDVFIDDLPEILGMDGYPPGLRAILFDPEGHYPEGAWQGRRFETHQSWASVATALLGAPV